jgi:four helix bundle protein
MGGFRRLDIWRRAHGLVLEFYRESADFSPAEQYGLTSQLRRSAASVPANIAEGSGRRGDPEFARFCRIALGSASETRYHLILAHDLGHLSSETHVRLDREVDEIMRMITSLLGRLAK